MERAQKIARSISVNDKGYRIGQDHPGAKLTDHEVDLVLELVDAGLSYRVIAAKMEISIGSVAAYVSGRHRAQTRAR